MTVAPPSGISSKPSLTSSKTVFSAEKAELIRLLLKESWNKLSWARSVWIYNHAAVDVKTGERFSDIEYLRVRDISILNLDLPPRLTVPP